MSNKVKSFEVGLIIAMLCVAGALALNVVTDEQPVDFEIIVDGEGSTDPLPGVYSVDKGKEVNIDIQAEYGWLLSKVTINGQETSYDVSSTSITVKMDADKTIEVLFVVYETESVDMSQGSASIGDVEAQNVRVEGNTSGESSLPIVMEFDDDTKGAVSNTVLKVDNPATLSTSGFQISGVDSTVLTISLTDEDSNPVTDLGGYVTITVTIDGEYDDPSVYYKAAGSNVPAVIEVTDFDVGDGKTTVTFRTNHFSEYVITESKFGAAAGNVFYKTFEQALVGADEDDTITLFEDAEITISEDVNFSKALTIASVEGDKKELKVNGTKVDVASGTVFENVKFYFNTSNNAFQFSGEKDVSFIDCEFDGECSDPVGKMNYIQAGMDDVFNGKLTVEDCVFDETAKNVNRAIRVVEGEKADVSVIGCTFITDGDSEGDALTPVKLSRVVSDDDLSKFSGNKFSNDGVLSNADACYVVGVSYRYIALNGSINAEAKVGDIYYESFEQAFEAAGSEDVIVLLKDVSVSKAALESKAFSINGGGKTLTIAETMIKLKSYTSFENVVFDTTGDDTVFDLSGSGVYDFTRCTFNGGVEDSGVDGTNYILALNFSGTLTVTNCAFDQTKEFINRSIRVDIVDNGADVIVEGCTFLNNDTPQRDTATPVKVSWANTLSISGIDMAGNVSQVGLRDPVAIEPVMVYGPEVTYCILGDVDGEDYVVDGHKAVLNAEGDWNILRIATQSEVNALANKMIRADNGATVTAEPLYYGAITLSSGAYQDPTGYPVGLIMDGNGAAFAAFNVGNKTIEGWTFKNCIFYGGLHFNNPSTVKNVTIDGCMFVDSRLTVYSTTVPDGICINGTKFVGKDDGGNAAIDIKHAKDVSVTNCVFDDIGHNAVQLTSMTGKIVISGNKIDGTTDRPLRFTDAGAVISITDNTIVSEGDDDKQLMKIDALSGEPKLTMTGNTWNGSDDSLLKETVSDKSYTYKL